MSNAKKTEGICGADCRYRALYEGSQTSLSDMAHRQAQALSRVGRLRNGVIIALRRNFSRSFLEAESALGHRLSEVDDEILLAYMGSLMSAAPTAAALPPEGLEELREALSSLGIQIPLGTDLTSWAESVKAQKASLGVVSDELSEIFGVDFDAPAIPAAFLAPPSGSVSTPTTKRSLFGSKKTKVEAPTTPEKPVDTSALEEAEATPARTPRRRTLQSLSEQSRALESAVPQTRDDLAAVFDLSASEPPAAHEEIPNDDVYAGLDIPVEEPPFDSEAPLPPSDPYSEPDEPAATLPFPDAVGVDKLADGADDLSKLFEGPKSDPPLSRSAMRRRKKNLRQMQAKETPPEEPQEPPVLASSPEVTRTPWSVPSGRSEINIKEVGEGREINVPDIKAPAVNVPEEESLPFPAAELPAASLEEVSAPLEKEEEAAPLKQMAAPALRPELLPLMSKTPRAKRGANKTVRTSAAPPDGRLFDVPTEGAPSSESGLDDNTRKALLAAVSIPRPVFTSDLVSVAGSRELVEQWEAECRASSTSQVRFVAAKTRHRMRGSLVLPVDFLREAATEFKRSVWAECMDRYRGASLYEIAVLLHKIESEVVSYRASEHTLTLRLNTRSGLVGIVMALGSKLGPGEMTRAAVAAELEGLLPERLTVIAVLTPRSEAFEAVCNAVTEEEKARKWAAVVPVIAARSWEYADDRGAASALLMGA